MDDGTLGKKNGGAGWGEEVFEKDLVRWVVRHRSNAPMIALTRLVRPCYEFV